jgi:hypothetical protein
MMLSENRHKPIRGRVLLVGKSTVVMEATEVDSLLESFDLPPCTKDLKLRDTITKASQHGFWIDDVELLTAVFPEITHIDIADISDYEGANLVLDMNQPINTETTPRYDFIYDSSVLDNVWNPSQMIINLSQLLSPNGRLLMHNVASFFPGALCAIHPEWFYSFFAINEEFADAKVYVFVENEESPPFFSPGHFGTLWNYSPAFTPLPDWKFRLSDASRSIKGMASTLVFAELAEKELGNVKIPINLQYIDSSGAGDWSALGKRFDNSPRPIVANMIDSSDSKVLKLTDFPHFSDQYKLCDEHF